MGMGPHSLVIMKSGRAGRAGLAPCQLLFFLASVALLI